MLLKSTPGHLVRWAELAVLQDLAENLVDQVKVVPERPRDQITTKQLSW
jgi:hypothetical protein